MRLDLKRPDHVVPEYSLTGDLLSFTRCQLQYRYYNGSSLPPSRPVQLWYGEFIHSLMESAFRLWKSNGEAPDFPWPCTPIGDERPQDPLPAGLPDHDLRVLGFPIEQILAQEGKQARSRRARRAAYRRAEGAVNLLGPHLFRLVSTAEQKVLGTRPLPPHEAGDEPRSSRYALRGVIDVLGELDLRGGSGNVVSDAVRAACPNLRGNYEVIVDYKGAYRPSTRGDQHWDQGDWQVQTYAWLRERQPEARPVAAGILIYVNELTPSSGDVGRIQRQIREGSTDVPPAPGSRDDYEIGAWNPGAAPRLSLGYRLRRALRVIPVTTPSKEGATAAFDRIVAQIEHNVLLEARLGHIGRAWAASCSEPSTCSACDFLSFCPDPAQGADPEAVADDDEFA